MAELVSSIRVTYVQTARYDSSRTNASPAAKGIYCPSSMQGPRGRRGIVDRTSTLRLFTLDANRSELLNSILIFRPRLFLGEPAASDDAAVKALFGRAGGIGRCRGQGSPLAFTFGEPLSR